MLCAKGSLRVEGTVEGDIADAVSVEIGRKGRVKGNIAAESLRVAGHLVGDVVASGSVELLSQSVFSGNLRTPRLRIEEGAVFDGRCQMSDWEKTPAHSRTGSHEEPLPAHPRA